MAHRQAAPRLEHLRPQAAPFRLIPAKGVRRHRRQPPVLNEYMSLFNARQGSFEGYRI
jgi:hypothetical protein